MVTFAEMRMKLHALALLLAVGAALGCRTVTRPQYALLGSIQSDSKTSVYWAETFLIQKGMKSVPRVDFKRTKREEQPKLDAMMNYWEALLDKDSMDEEYDTFLMIQSPLYLGEW